jgi:hypothetical protein
MEEDMPQYLTGVMSRRSRRRTSRSRASVRRRRLPG